MTETLELLDLPRFPLSWHRRSIHPSTVLARKAMAAWIERQKAVRCYAASHEPFKTRTQHQGPTPRPRAAAKAVWWRHPLPPIGHRPAQCRAFGSGRVGRLAFQGSSEPARRRSVRSSLPSGTGLRVPAHRRNFRGRPCQHARPARAFTPGGVGWGSPRRSGARGEDRTLLRRCRFPHARSCRRKNRGGTCPPWPPASDSDSDGALVIEFEREASTLL